MKKTLLIILAIALIAGVSAKGKIKAPPIKFTASTSLKGLKDNMNSYKITVPTNDLINYLIAKKLIDNDTPETSYARYYSSNDKSEARIITISSYTNSKEQLEYLEKIYDKNLPEILDVTFKDKSQPHLITYHLKLKNEKQDLATEEKSILDNLITPTILDYVPKENVTFSIVDDSDNNQIVFKIDSKKLISMDILNNLAGKINYIYNIKSDRKP